MLKYLNIYKFEKLFLVCNIKKGSKFYNNRILLIVF